MAPMGFKGFRQQRNDESANAWRKTQILTYFWQIKINFHQKARFLWSLLGPKDFVAMGMPLFCSSKNILLMKKIAKIRHFLPLCFSHCYVSVIWDWLSTELHGINRKFSLKVSFKHFHSIQCMDSWSAFYSRKYNLRLHCKFMRLRAIQLQDVERNFFAICSKLTSIYNRGISNVTKQFIQTLTALTGEVELFCKFLQH